MVTVERVAVAISLSPTNAVAVPELITPRQPLGAAVYRRYDFTCGIKMLKS